MELAPFSPMGHLLGQKQDMNSNIRTFPPIFWSLFGESPLIPGMNIQHSRSRPQIVSNHVLCPLASLQDLTNPCTALPSKGMEKEESWSGKCWQFRSLRLTPMMLDMLDMSNDMFATPSPYAHCNCMQLLGTSMFGRSCSNSWINGKSKYPPQWLWNSHFWRLQNMQVLLVPFELQGWTLSGWSIKDVVQLFFLSWGHEELDWRQNYWCCLSWRKGVTS